MSGDGSTDLSPAQVLETLAGDPPGHASPGAFRPGPGVGRLTLRFDPDELRRGAEEVLSRIGAAAGDGLPTGFDVVPLTRRPDAAAISPETAANDRSGRYWAMAPTTTGGFAEAAFEAVVDEAAFTDLADEVLGTALEPVIRSLQAVLPIGRVRLNGKALYNCNSWHRDPEPRLHIPIQTDPGALMVVGDHVTHLPADGSVYLTDTRAYHTALNGGQAPRLHLVAALAI